MKITNTLINVDLMRLFQTNKIETMSRAFLVLSFALSFHLFVDAAHAQCPEENPRGLRIVENFLTEDRYAERREAYNISASVDSIRSLNEEQDLEACTYFSSPSDEDEPYRAMRLYKAEDYYFVLYLIRPRAEWPDPESLLSAPPEIGSVYSQDFEPLALFSL